MAIMIELKPELEARLAAQAQASGLPIDLYVERVLERQATRVLAPSETPAAMDRLLQIARAFDELPDLDPRSADEILGYNDIGLPN